MKKTLLALFAAVLVCGSPVYCGYPTAGLRAFMERFIFPAVNYSDFSHPIVNKPKRSATIFTMNCPDEEVYRANNYHILMDASARQLGDVLVPTLYRIDGGLIVALSVGNETSAII